MAKQRTSKLTPGETRALLAMLWGDEAQPDDVIGCVAMMVVQCKDHPDRVHVGNVTVGLSNMEALRLISECVDQFPG